MKKLNAALQNWRVFWRLLRRLLSPLWRFLQRGR